MAVTKVEVDEATCDGCGKVQYSPVEEPTFGIHIHWSEIDRTGGFGGVLFACNTSCAVKAIRNRSAE